MQKSLVEALNRYVKQVEFNLVIFLSFSKRQDSQPQGASQRSSTGKSLLEKIPGNIYLAVNFCLIMFTGLKHSTTFQIWTSGNNCTQHNHNLFLNNDIMLQKSDVQLDLTISLCQVTQLS